MRGLHDAPTRLNNHEGGTSNATDSRCRTRGAPAGTRAAAAEAHRPAWPAKAPPSEYRLFARGARSRSLPPPPSVTVQRLGARPARGCEGGARGRLSCFSKSEC